MASSSCSIPGITSSTSNSSSSIPSYTIDLAQPPRQRYARLARDYAERMRSLQYLFDEILHALFPAMLLRKSVRFMARMTLHRLHDDEETQEIKGISRATGVPLYLMVVFNTVLDYLLGCTSGAVRVRPTPAEGGGGKVAGPVRMMHFRTLDWGMDKLRDLLVVLEYVDSSSPDPRRVIARSITYAGFVGTLTAVRENMSLSMNFRANHTCSAYALRYHKIMVLMGRRRSIASVFRAFILGKPLRKTKSAGSRSGSLRSGSRSTSGGSGSRSGSGSGSPEAPPQPPSLEDRARELAALRFAPCYVILCDGDRVAAVEKDLARGSVRTHRDFLVQTNHDVHEEAPSSDPDASVAATQAPAAAATPTAKVKSSNAKKGAAALGFQEWLKDSTNRRDNMLNKWRDHMQNQTPAPASASASASVTTSLATAEGRSSRASVNAGSRGEGQGPPPSIAYSTLKSWIDTGPITNDCTHFSCILDPKMGGIRWIRGLDPP